MPDTIRAAVIGTGFAGGQHVEAIRRVPAAQVVAIAGSSGERARDAGARLGVGRAYGDYRELLEREDLDVVHVCVPNDLHREIVAAALAAGRHVVAEKPLARDSAEARELVDLAAASDRLAVLCHNYRFYSVVAELRAAALERLGRLHTVRGAYLQDWLLWETDANWRIDPVRAGAGRAVADIGTHWLDLAETVTGRRATAVLADLATVHPRRRAAGESPFGTIRPGAGEPDWIDVTTEDSATLLLRFGDGLRGVVDVSQVAAGHKNDFWLAVEGTHGAATWHQERPDEIVLGWRDRPNEILVRQPREAAGGSAATLPAGHTEGWRDGLRNLVAAAYAVIRGEVVPNELPVPLPTFADGLHYLEVVEAALASHAGGAWVAVPETTAAM